jgi:hypothetical protein
LIVEVSSSQVPVTRRVENGRVTVDLTRPHDGSTHLVDLDLTKELRITTDRFEHRPSDDLIEIELSHRAVVEGQPQEEAPRGSTSVT